MTDAESKVTEDDAKVVSYFFKKPVPFCVKICEQCVTVGLHIWPASLFLAEYISQNADLFKDKVVLELGAGVSLPSIVAAKIGARRVILTDLPDCHENIKVNLKLNDVKEPLAQVKKLVWGRSFGAADFHVDVILGADIFYDEKLFEAAVVTVKYLLESRAKEKINGKEKEIPYFLTLFQKRGTSTELYKTLTVWDLHWECIDLAEAIIQSENTKRYFVEEYVALRVTLQTT